MRNRLVPGYHRLGDVRHRVDGGEERGAVTELAEILLVIALTLAGCEYVAFWT